uniref:DAO domain-containing protein n=1 Tax=Rhabditophanes sp. KR3021 TaxID=114890 RepID=A0AC35TPC1_9BILA
MLRPKVAIIGEGVIGLSSALAIKQKFPQSKITVYSDKPFEETCSFGPAGIFRVDKVCHREYAKDTFERLAFLEKTVGIESGIKLLSGHVQSHDRKILEDQETVYGDIVYNFHWLNEREKRGLFAVPPKHCFHFTTYAAEGRKYVPWLKKQITKVGVTFERKKVNNFDELGHAFDVVVNAAGLEGGKLAGDDDSVVPSRGIAIEVDAVYHKHFNYEGLNTFTIPMSNSVMLGTVKQVGRTDMVITEEDRNEIWSKYLKIHPTFKGAKVLSEWISMRPDRPEIRLEAIKKSLHNKDYLLVHNYGSGSNGFALHWGCATRVANFIERDV